MADGEFGPGTRPLISGRQFTNESSFFSVDGDDVDGEPSDFLPLGSVVAFELSGANNHPIHMHVFPYQLQEAPPAPRGLGEYFKAGDWQDTLLLAWSKDTETPLRVRSNIDRYGGNLVMHCHLLT